MEKALLLIGIIPSKKICGEVNQFKLFAKEHFQSGHALNAPPHITLISPFHLEMPDFQALDSTLKVFVKNQKEFYLGLDNFSAFPPRVIFVDIIANVELNTLKIELSKALKEKLNLADKDHKRDFHPHLTVAFKDLTKERFEPAWQHFSKKKYSRSFLVKSIFLLKHENKKWHILKEYLFR